MQLTSQRLGLPQNSARSSWKTRLALAVTATSVALWLLLAAGISVKSSYILLALIVPYFVISALFISSVNSARSWVVIFLLAGSAVSIAVFYGSVQDYVAFGRMWTHITAGGNPYAGPNDIPPNAYGPLFNALAIFALVHPLFPKAFFTIIWVLTGAWITRFAVRTQPESQALACGVAAYLLLCPFFWVEVLYFGHFDILVASCCIAAIHLRVSGREVLSGIVLSIGILLKFVPVALLPFLALDGRKVRMPVIVSCVLTTGIGMATSLALWGRSALSPILFAVGRDPSGLSIWADLNLMMEAWAIALKIQKLTLPTLAVCGLLLFAAVMYTRLDITTSSLLACLVVLALYKVGHPQFFIVLVIMIPYWCVVNWSTLRTDVGLSVAFCCCVAWLTVYDVWFAYSKAVFPRWHLAGVYTFCVGIWVIWELLRNRAVRLVS